jgi:hypothetical protein
LDVISPNNCFILSMVCVWLCDVRDCDNGTRSFDVDADAIRRLKNGG